MSLIWRSVLLSGVAFGKIVSSFVADVIMPPIGVALGGVNFSDLGYVIQAAVGEAPAVVIAYGKFIQTVVDFTIIAFAVFVAVKVISSMNKKEEEAPAAPPKPSNEESLLIEIRDLLNRIVDFIITTSIVVIKLL